MTSIRLPPALLAAISSATTVCTSDAWDRRRKGNSSHFAYTIGPTQHSTSIAAVSSATTACTSDAWDRRRKGQSHTSLVVPVCLRPAQYPDGGETGGISPGGVHRIRAV
eukprot:1182083-Prorocentrum_minimum.AAC.2